MVQKDNKALVLEASSQSSPLQQQQVEVEPNPCAVPEACCVLEEGGGGEGAPGLLPGSGVGGVEVREERPGIAVESGGCSITGGQQHRPFISGVVEGNNTVKIC